MDFELFKRIVNDPTKPRNHKIKHSLGVYDCYKEIRKNKWFDIGKPLTEKEFYSIIRTTNKYIAEYISIGKIIVLPNNMGAFEIRKKTKKIIFDNGKVKTNTRINWNETLKLWYEDEECFNEKRLVRNNVNLWFCVYWNKILNFTNFNNKTIMLFKPNRYLLGRIKQNYLDGKLLDAFLLNEYYK